MRIRRIVVPACALEEGRAAMVDAFGLDDVAAAVRRSCEEVGVDAGETTLDEFALEAATRLVARESDRGRIVPDGDGWRRP